MEIPHLAQGCTASSLWAWEFYTKQNLSEYKIQALNYTIISLVVITMMVTEMVMMLTVRMVMIVGEGDDTGDGIGEDDNGSDGR